MGSGRSMKRTECMVCGGSSLHTFIDLGDKPNANAFLRAAEFGQEVSRTVEWYAASLGREGRP